VREGTQARLYDSLGCHLTGSGAHFAVWAPNARAVHVIGDFNGWDAGAHPLTPRGDHSGIWEGFMPDVQQGQVYMYRILSQHRDHVGEKADPFALYAELPPATGSRAWNLDYQWHDQRWMAERGRHNALDAPMSIYELHPGSWRRRDG